MNKTLELQEELITNFKNLWYENYLLSLREHGGNIYQNKWENRIKVGDNQINQIHKCSCNKKDKCCNKIDK